MAFRVGQKVVFVGGNNRSNNIVAKFSSIQRNQVYTVRSLDDRYTLFFGSPWIRLQEFAFDEVTWNGEQVEPAWDPLFFRPAVERKTDISSLKALLVPGAKISEDA